MTERLRKVVRARGRSYGRQHHLLHEVSGAVVQRRSRDPGRRSRQIHAVGGATDPHTVARKRKDTGEILEKEAVTPAACTCLNKVGPKLVRTDFQDHHIIVKNLDFDRHIRAGRIPGPA
jgi:hypothetical protein